MERCRGADTMAEQEPSTHLGPRPETPASLRRAGIVMLLLCGLLLGLERNAFTYTVAAVGFVMALAFLFSTQVLVAMFYVTRAIMRGPRRPPDAD
jgi:hypothetical protein